MDCDIKLLAQGDGSIDDLVFVCHTHGCAFTLEQMTFESLCPDGLEEIETQVAPTLCWKGARRHSTILRMLHDSWLRFLAS